MNDEWPVFVVTVRSRVQMGMLNRALRAWLKIGLRKFGFECIGLATHSKKESEVMDMRQFAPKYINPDSVRDEPIVTRILVVLDEPDRYGRPVIELENGSQFSVNETNRRILVKAWGYESDDWRGQEIEFSLGTYKDWQSNPPVDKETVKVRAISPSGNGGEPSKALPPSRVGVGGAHPSLKDDLDDSVPFAPEWR